MEVSGSYLAQFTGCTWRTVQKRLERAGVHPIRTEGAAHLYDSVRALAAILGPPARADDAELAEDLREHEATMLASCCSDAFIPAALALHERFGLDAEQATRAAAGTLMFALHAHAGGDEDAEYDTSGPLDAIGRGAGNVAVAEVRAAIDRLHASEKPKRKGRA